MCLNCVFSALVHGTTSSPSGPPNWVDRWLPFRCSRTLSQTDSHVENSRFLTPRRWRSGSGRNDNGCGGRVKIKVKVNGKGNGQECPFHMTFYKALTSGAGRGGRLLFAGREAYGIILFTQWRIES